MPSFPLHIVLLKYLFFSLCVCMCIMCVLGSYGDNKKAFDLLKLKLQIVLSCSTWVGAQPRSFGRTAHAFNCRAFSTAPCPFDLIELYAS